MGLAKSTLVRIATLVVLCMLFAQISTAAYACPQLLKSASSMAGSQMAAMMDCDAMKASQMDSAQPNLCKAHCQLGQQSPDTRSIADVQPMALDLLQSLVWVLQPIAATSQVASVAQSPQRPPGSPPLYLVHQVFRL